MEADFMGKLVNVEIMSASKFSMISRVVGEASEPGRVVGEASVPGAAAVKTAAPVGTSAPAAAKEGGMASVGSVPLPLLATAVAALAYLVLRFLSMW